MRPALCSVLIFLSGSVAFGAAVPASTRSLPSGIKSYREWKNTKVQEAALRLKSAKKNLGARKADPNLAKSQALEGRMDEAQRIEATLSHERSALETAQELSVPDYFAGYLTKLSDKNAAFKEVAGKLSPEEVAELMEAYANSVFGTQTGRIAPSAQNLNSENLK